MNITFNLTSILLLFGAAQGFFIALILSQKRGNHRANQLLSLLIVLYSIYIVDAALEGLNFYYEYPQFFGLTRGLPFTFGALHFIYAKKLISPEIKLSKFHILHFGFFIAYRLYTFTFDFESANYKLEFMQGPPVSELNIIHGISGCIILIQGFIYMFCTLVILKEYSQKIKEIYSSIDKINLNWLRNITYLALTAWIVATLEKVFPDLSYKLFFGEEFPVAIVLSFVVYAMGYLSQRQPQIFSQAEFSIFPDPPNQIQDMKIISSNEKFEETNKDFDVKYEKSGLTSEKAKKHLNELLTLMEKEKPFLNSTITLSDLSEELSVSSHNLSEIINTQLKQSFFDFINMYRVEEVKNALIDPAKSHYTLLSIALDCGFNSKTSFNTVFKKHTNLTPTQYKQVIAVT